MTHRSRTARCHEPVMAIAYVLVRVSCVSYALDRATRRRAPYVPGGCWGRTQGQKKRCTFQPHPTPVSVADLSSDACPPKSKKAKNFLFCGYSLLNFRDRWVRTSRRFRGTSNFKVRGERHRSMHEDGPSRG